ncbi:SH3 domain-containing kinase-binding protein 1 isoform X2 [Erpetoichthys calabaricus]|uniref:SH3 domain-containing kinase-binding protein 1 isoform X2 n=1 Tax=Erpetoichthys calabaricus TaxID=27687 RepID=UPI0022340B69|nr:SH3 domain-containing kinase-binding protein 1 isoform X2 [Erpetoichthys calabaricus]
MVEAIVEFDYKAQHDDELTISIGDIIKNIRKDDGGWWEGEINGKRGVFPDNFVKEIKKDVKKEVQGHKLAEKPKQELSNGSPLIITGDFNLRNPKKGDKIRKRRCKVAFSYTPQNEDELELKIGDIIEVLAEVEEGWWEGCLNGKTGMFPSNFIKEIAHESEDASSTQEEKITKTTTKDSTGSESDGGDSGSTKSDGGSVSSNAEIQPKKIKGIGFGDIFKDKPIKLRPRSMDVDTELISPEKQSAAKKLSSVPAAHDGVKTEADNRTKGKEYCKVLFPYEAQNEDELTIKEGDIITILWKDCTDAGWWQGELNGKRGLFPDNFVKILSQDTEKERPRKPPPPAAPVGKQIADKKPEVRKMPPERPEYLPSKEEEKEDKHEKDLKHVDTQKTVLPVVPPKKPLPPKTNSLNRPASFPPKRPERPTAPASCIRSESPKSDVGSVTSGSTTEKDASEKPNDFDVEDFDSVVPVSEKLNHPTASRPRITDRRPRSQLFTSVSENKAVLPPKPGIPSLSCTGTGGQTPLSSTVHHGVMGTGQRPSSPSHFKEDVKPKNDQASNSQNALEELRLQVKELKTVIDHMKVQHKKEIKQLMNELDEEKKIRLSLQMEVEHIKKVLHSK